VEAQASGDELDVIRQLRILRDLAALHRSLPAAQDESHLRKSIRRPDSAPAIGSWAHLELIERLGRGTFGEVYRAWDGQLECEVALKLLRADKEADDLRTSRIAREGRLLARVRHPNVITVYGVAVHEGRVGMWMELIRGATLEQLVLKRGSFSAREAALIGTDICRALAAVHGAGLVHRDVKAQNVMREDGGRIVLMDLGTGREMAPDRTHPLADLAGTPLYLAPEIFQGAPASARTDLYGLGVLLYHLVTGTYPVRADSIDALQEAHAKGQAVRLRDARADLPTAFVTVFDRAIAPDADKRYQTPGALEADLVKALDDRAVAASSFSLSDIRANQREMTPAAIIKEETQTADRKPAALPGNVSRTPSPREEPPVRHRSRPVVWMVATIIAIVAVAISTRLWRTQTRTVSGAADVSATRLVMPLSVPLADNPLPSLAISPDATRVVYVGGSGKSTRLYLRVMSEIDAEPLPGTQGASGPFFSPDGAAVGFFADGKLKRLSFTDRKVATLCDAPSGRGASWGWDNSIVFAPEPNGGLFRISADGGQPRPLTRLLSDRGERTHRWPHVLPGDAGVLFTVGFADASSYDDASIAVLSPDSSDRRILAQGTFPAYLATGYLIYTRQGSILAAPFDAHRYQLSGAPVPVLHGIETRPLSGSAALSVSQAGTLIYASTAGTAKGRLVWSDHRGNPTLVSEREAAFSFPRLSPDGNRLVVTITGDDGTSDLWMYEIGRDTLWRLTSGGINMMPIWSPDGKRIVFASRKNSSVFNLWSIAADGSGVDVRLRPSVSPQVPSSWSSDGKFLAFTEVGSNTNLDTWIMRMDGTYDAEPLLNGQYDETSAVFSPDNQWLAYASSETGRREVYVRRFAGAGQRWQISADGGAEPAWAPSGTELYFRNGNKMMHVPIKTGGQFSPGRPTEMFEARYDLDSTHDSANFDVARDGQRFLMIRRDVGPAPPPLTVVFRWSQEVARIIPFGLQPQR
jgi:serine/threonine-protein kinase